MLYPTQHGFAWNDPMQQLANVKIEAIGEIDGTKLVSKLMGLPLSTFTCLLRAGEYEFSKKVGSLSDL